MRELRYAGPGADAEHVLLVTTDGDEQFSLHLDSALRHALPPTETGRAAEIAAGTVEPAISPREIQTRVRAGASPEEVATQVGVAPERIRMFAAPVLDERIRMTGEARRARARRGTDDATLVQFGEAVDQRYAAHGIDPASVAWDAHRRDDGAWVISATWRGGDADRTAQWAFLLSARTVSPLDETAADLLSDRPIRPVVRAVPEPPPQPAPAVAMREPAPVAPGPAKDEAERRTTAPIPVVQPAVQADDATTDTASDEDDNAVPLPLRLATPPRTPPSRPTETDDQRAARARIPSWDDIMLGVRRKRD